MSASLEDVGGQPGGAALRDYLASIGENSQNSLIRALGLQAWTVDPRMCGDPHQATTGIVHGVGVLLEKDQVITGLGVLIATAGASLTHGQLGIYDSTLATLLAVTADNPTNFQSTGWRTDPVAGGPWIVPKTDLYYFADVYTGTTMPFYVDNAALTNTLSRMPAAAGQKWLWWQDTGPYNSLPASPVPALSQHPHCIIAY